jgi:hypothetical protein
VLFLPCGSYKYSYEHSNKNICLNPVFSSQGIYLGVELLRHVARLCFNFLWNQPWLVSVISVDFSPWPAVRIITRALQGS